MREIEIDQQRISEREKKVRVRGRINDQQIINRRRGRKIEQQRQRISEREREIVGERETEREKLSDRAS